jgi:hypothetical protein
MGLVDVTRRLRPSPPAAMALGVFAVALVVRLVWVAAVDSPYDNVFSDMGGYVQRALQAAYGEGDPHPIFVTLYPPGAHLFYAAEMKLVGWSHHAPLLLLNCAWGAVVAPCTALLALRVVPRLSVAAAMGLLVAFWYPLVAFAGFFSSEQPYAGAIALSAWLLVRHLEQGKGAVALGVTTAIAYLVRPQIILTIAALGVAGAFVLWRRPAGAPHLRARRLAIAGAILGAAVVFGAVRYHALSGRWGLVSDNAAMTRLWADTDYGVVRAVWQAPNGESQEFFFGSPPKGNMGEHRELFFQGYVGDPDVLDRARRDAVAHMPWTDRVVRWVTNVRLLFGGNDLWPDSMHVTGPGWRAAWRAASLFLLSSSLLLGIWGAASTLRRPRVVLVVCLAHVLTALVVAAFFFAEMRYRVPYDMFFLLLALEGARQIKLAYRRTAEPTVAAGLPARTQSAPAAGSSAPPAPVRTRSRSKGRRRG